jgi:hypothetical protein
MFSDVNGNRVFTSMFGSRRGRISSAIISLGAILLLGWSTTYAVAGGMLSIGGFGNTQGPSELVTFTGVVSGGSPNTTVTFSGLPSLAGKSVTVGTGGEFSLTVQLGAGECGIVTAVAKDNGSTSNPAVTYVYPQ